jgi:O-antigen ligase
MKMTRVDRSDRLIYLVGAVVIALVVGLAVPVLSNVPYAIVVIGIGPALVAFWNPEILVVLLQDALGILRMLTGGIGLEIESGFAMATMIIAVVAYGAMAFRYRLNWSALLSPLAFLNYSMAAVLAVALVSSGGSQYGVQKLTGFVAFNILSFVLTSLTPAERRSRLLYSFILVGFIALFSMALGSGSQYESRAAGFGGNPIWTARLLCAAALVLILGVRGPIFLRLPLAGGFLAASVFTGSRGPLLSVAIVIVVALLLRATLARGRESAGAALVGLAMLLAAAGIGLAGLRIIAEQQAASNPRSPFVRIFAESESAQSSSETRVELYESSLAVFGDSPLLGGGLGGLADETQPQSANLYSHNLLLEIASETGLFGLLIHVVTLVVTIAMAIHYLRSPDARLRRDIEIGLLLLIFAYANAQVSGDLVGNKMVWFFLGFINGTIPAWRSPGATARVAVRRQIPRVRSRPRPTQSGRL